MCTMHSFGCWQGINKRMSKYIDIKDAGVSATGKTRVWDVRNNRTKESVGQVKWYGGWRKYAFFPTMPQYEGEWMVFDEQCMRKLADFIDQVNAEFYKGRRGKPPVDFG